MKNPTKEMLESREFFKSNSDRVAKIVSWLFDEESKECFSKIIEFRGYRNPDHFPPQSRKKVYFGYDFFYYGKHEILVDCGAFTGDTIASFKRAMRKLGGGCDGIIAFEPDPFNYKILRNEYKDVIAFNYGAWDNDTTLSFHGGNMSSARITDEEWNVNGKNVIKVPVKAIDNCEECLNATIIKMDIEGAELSALKGAEKTILRNKPKLAICIYHSDEDMLRIAEWIHEKVPEYKLYVRQHNNYLAAETVLYAAL